MGERLCAVYVCDMGTNDDGGKIVLYMKLYANICSGVKRETFARAPDKQNGRRVAPTPVSYIQPGGTVARPSRRCFVTCR
jgi:hypothetical protein